MTTTPTDHLGPRTATMSEAAPLADSLAAAFSDDPVFGWLMPDSATRVERLARFFRLELRQLALRYGQVWTTDGLAAAALCMPPGTWHMPARVAISQAPDFVRMFGRRLALASGLFARMESRHLREPHFYFAYIGVAPHQQGEGIGTRLMQPTLERCDLEQLPAYLEASSERNATLYERLGFVHQEQFGFAGSPPLRPMIRPPRMQR